MVDTTFTLTSGTYSDEQDLLGQLDFFITTTVGGWQQAKVVTNTPTDLNIAYYSDGSNIGFYERSWFRVRATGDELVFVGMTYFDVNADTSLDAYNNTYTRLPTGGAGGKYWLLANRDVVHVVIDRNSDGTTYHGGFGLFSTYYSRTGDPRPTCVFGQTAVEQTFDTVARLEAFQPTAWGTGFSATSSGTHTGYKASHPADIAYGTPNPRSGEPKLIEPVFYTSETFPYYEARGEVPGLYMCGGAGYTHGSFATITGTLGTTAGNYFIHRHSDTYAWAVGPTTVSGEG